MKPIRQIIKSVTNIKFLKCIVVELAVITSLVSVTLLELWHIMHATDLAKIFFDGSDMLTLSLFADSLKKHEALDWIFSSQTFMFPEIPLYLLSSQISSSFKLALTINIFIIILILYIGLRLISKQFTQSRSYSRLFSLIGCCLAVLFAFCEPANNLVASYFFMTTAYYGIILTSLFSLVICVHLLKNPFKKDRKTYLLLLSSFLIACATTSSSTLYVLQFLLPLMVIFSLAYFLSIASFKKLAYVIAPQILGSIVGIILAKLVFKSLFAPAGALQNYFHINGISPAIIFFYTSGKTALSTKSQAIELVVIIALFIAACLLSLVFLKQYTKKKQPIQLNSFLQKESFVVLGMSVLPPFISVAGAIATGNAALRYLLPFIIFPYIGLATLLRIKLFPPIVGKRIITIALSSLVVLTLLLATISNPLHTLDSIITYKSDTVTCIEKSLRNTPYRHGLAGFGRARSVALNNDIGADVIQLTSDLKQYNWLVNHAKYQHYDADFIIVEKASNNYTDISPNISGPALLADGQPNIFLTPSHIYPCSDFNIYVYDKNNPAKKVINERLKLVPDKAIQ